jgi:hypothetical protein
MQASLPFQPYSIVNAVFNVMLDCLFSDEQPVFWKTLVQHMTRLPDSLQDSCSII